MRIHFTEPGRLINLFLTALFCRDRKTPWHLSLSLADLVQIIIFAKHFDCADLIDRLGPILESYAKDKLSDPYESFRAAAMVGRWDICVTAMTAAPAKWRWGKSKTNEQAIDLALGCVHDGGFLDPLAMPYHWWLQLPKKVLWAMVRASTDKSAGGAKQRTVKQKADRFKRLMELIEGESVWVRTR